VSDIGASEQHTDAAAPDDPRKPASPTELSKPSWKYVLRRTLREFALDQCIDSAGSLTYFGVLSLFPAMLAIFSLLGVLGQRKQAAAAVLNLVKQVAPGSAAGALRAPIEQFANSPGAGVALISGIVLAIWSASGYVSAFSRAMNRIYEVDEGRPYWKRKPVQLLVTVVVIVLVLVIAIGLIVSGPVTHAVGAALGLGATASLLWSILKWPLLAIAMIVMIAILYHATPNVKQPRFRWISLGGVVALTLIVAASFGFGLYVANFSHYNKSYGSLAGIIIFLIWLWIANLALLFGAEFDAELERARELQAGLPAEESIQLPPRDAAKSVKSLHGEKVDIREGRKLADAHGENDSSAPTQMPLHSERVK
jgi:membrane protein